LLTNGFAINRAMHFVHPRRLVCHDQLFNALRDDPTPITPLTERPNPPVEQCVRLRSKDPKYAG